MRRAHRISALCAAVAAGLALAAAAPGAAPPAPAPQTVYDSTLHVTWLADADLAATQKFGLGVSWHGLTPINADGSMTYATAKEWVHRLDQRKWDGHKDWTLPVTPTPYGDSGCSGYNRSGGGRFGLGCTRAPLAELYSHWLGVPSPDTTVPIPDTPTGPFHDFQPYLYWTGQPFAGGYRTFSFNTGYAKGSNQPEHWMYVLPVLSGDPFGGTAKSGLERVDGGQAVYEPGAGVTWLADADYARTHRFSYGGEINRDGSMQEPTAVKDWVPALNSGAVLGRHGGWRLPTLAELAALDGALQKAGDITAGEPVVRVPDLTLQGLQDIQPYLYWSCAGPSIHLRCQGVPNSNNQQWSFSFGNGFLGTDVRENELYVMVYYVNRQRVPPPPGPRPTGPTGHCPPHQPGGPITCK